LTLEVLKVPRTTRIGTRFVFLAPSDSLEEADRFMWKAAASPLSEAVAEKSKSTPSEAQVGFLLDDSASGYRRRFALSSLLVDQKPEDAPFLGLPGEPGSGGVGVDIDTYNRPEETHLAKASVFVQESFLRARSLTADILAWMLGHQK
jgi:hypothetical protein